MLLEKYKKRAGMEDLELIFCLVKISEKYDPALPLDRLSLKIFRCILAHDPIKTEHFSSQQLAMLLFCRSEKAMFIILWLLSCVAYWRLLTFVKISRLFSFFPFLCRVNSPNKIHQQISED